MKVCLWNARSLNHKLPFLQSITYCKSPNVVVITETWLSEFTGNSEIFPSQYTIYRRDRPARGGGILLAVSDHIPSTLLLTSPSEEIIVVKLFTSLHIYLCCVYIPPHSPLSVFNAVFNCLHVIPQNSHLLLLGDCQLK